MGSEQVRKEVRGDVTVNGRFVDGQFVAEHFVARQFVERHIVVGRFVEWMFRRMDVSSNGCFIEWMFRRTAFSSKVLNRQPGIYVTISFLYC